MSGGVLFLYVDAKSVECNEAYESFSAACVLALPRRLQRFVHDVENRLHLLPLRPAGVQILYAVEAPVEHRHVVWGLSMTQGIDGISWGHDFLQRHPSCATVTS